MFNLLSGYHLIDFVGHTDCISSVAFTPEGKNVITASIDGTVKVFDTLNGKLVQDLKGHHGPIFSMAINYNTKKIEE